MKGKSINIRGIDVELYRLARAEAIKKGYRGIGEWLNEAIKEKLAREAMK